MEFYHTYNRGVEKRKIFLENVDYLRAINDMYEFNDENDIVNTSYRFGKNPNLNILAKPRQKLIDLECWALMPNHYHFLLSPVKDNSLPKYHKKFGVGYTNFFNGKYKRSGVLFQGGYKKIRLVDDRQALQLICYIHANPLDLWKPNWKEQGLNDLEIQNALKFLKSDYRWSSHLDWWGVKNFPSLINNNFTSLFFKNPEEYQEFFINWLKYYAKNIESLQGFTLE